MLVCWLLSCLPGLLALGVVTVLIARYLRHSSPPPLPPVKEPPAYPPAPVGAAFRPVPPDHEAPSKAPPLELQPPPKAIPPELRAAPRAPSQAQALWDADAQRAPYKAPQPRPRLRRALRRAPSRPL